MEAEPWILLNSIVVETDRPAPELMQLMLLKDTVLAEYLGNLLDSGCHLIHGVGSHEAETDERIIRSHSG